MRGLHGSTTATNHMEHDYLEVGLRPWLGDSKLVEAYVCVMTPVRDKKTAISGPIPHFLSW
jgi:hypothetical protein